MYSDRASNVTRGKEYAIAAKMRSLGIREADLEERFIRAGGSGGQKINKTSACVYLKHTPTGIEVKCQSARSQALNRFLARRLLADKIESLVLGRESEARKKVEKIRRQKRRRSRRARDKMLKNKKLHSEKKALRRFSTDE